MTSYTEAKRNISKFRSNNKDLIPALTNDWKIEIDDYYQQGTKIVVSSENLGQKIDCGESGRFMDNYVLGGMITFKKGMIQEQLAYSYNGFLTESQFFESEDIVEAMEQNKPFKPSELKESMIYKSMDEDYFIHLGELNVNYINLVGENSHFYSDDIKRTKKYLMKLCSDSYTLSNKIVFETVISKQSKNKLIEEINYVDDDVFSLAINKGLKEISSHPIYFRKSIKVIEKDENDFCPYSSMHNIIKHRNKYFYFVGRKSMNESDIKAGYTLVSGSLSRYGSSVLLYKEINDFDKFKDALSEQMFEIKDNIELTQFLDSEKYIFTGKEKGIKSITLN